MNRAEILARISGARELADIKWERTSLAEPLAGHSDYKIATILMEEVGEIARAIIENDNENLVDEIFDVLQVCVAWLESK